MDVKSNTILLDSNIVIYSNDSSLPIVTNNTKDFQHIKQLQLIDL